MNTWLHFVGKSNYTPARFTREAKQHGVSRRISRQDLERMTWGDKVYLAIKDGRENALVFGYFVVERIAGLDAETLQLVAEKHGAELQDMGGELVARECGQYITGPSYSTEASIRDICRCLPAEKLPLMVVGSMVPFGPVKLLKVPHRQGFRPFDESYFKVKVKLWDPTQDRRRKIPAVRGQFYAKPEPPGEGEAGTVTGIETYSRR